MTIRTHSCSGATHSDAHCQLPMPTTTHSVLSMDGVADRAAKAWAKAKPKLAPIGLQECRHTAASWLDPAGVSPKTASILMGHSIPDRQPGAAAITLARYTHLMPGSEAFARFSG